MSNGAISSVAAYFKKVEDDRLVWVHWNGNWWPGVTYESYSHVLREHSKDLGSIARKKLIVKAIGSSLDQKMRKEKVSLVLGHFEFVSSNKTRTFIDNMGRMLLHNLEDKFDPADWQLYQNALKDMSKYMDEPGSKPTICFTEGDPPSDSDTRVSSDSESSGKRHRDHSEESDSSSDDTSPKKRKRSKTPPKSRKPAAFSKKKRPSDKDRIWGRTTKKPKTSSLAQKPHGKGFYAWPTLWSHLKGRGWKDVPAWDSTNRRFYLKPRVEPGTGDLGRHYFTCAKDVIKFAKDMDLETKLSTREETESETDETSDGSESSTEQWWHIHPVPQFKDVWKHLKTMGIKYGLGYQIPGSNIGYMNSDYDLQKCLCKRGIPNLDKCDESLKATLTRWASFAHFPTKSEAGLRTVELITNREAAKLLCENLGYEQHKGGVFSLRRTNQEWASLEDLRAHIRGLADLQDDNGSGRRRRTGPSLGAQDVLELRLWAARSTRPLPIFDPTQVI